MSLPAVDPPPDDVERRAQAGDVAARAELLAREVRPLRAFIRRRAGALVRAHESASDLVQSVCREVLAELARLEFRGRAPFRAWLRRAAERKVIDRARRLAAQRRGGAHIARRRTDPDALDPDDAALASLVTGSRAAAAREEVARVEAALATLSPEHREVILLARVRGLPHEEIAAAMGRSEGAVRVLLYRALAELGERLR